MPILLLILNTGMRIGEALALEWSDIDFENKTLRETLTKRKNVTIMVMSWEKLRKHLVTLKVF
ncbi:tyrosine-type recombinase/integrase [Lacrimispora sp. 38-1]|uniref:tyrosine-type recombinase/integrase n=1 Tax=Lacrimispora sp. 38-1 TaxID=3125778 RepID=UPI003CE99A65